MELFKLCASAGLREMSFRFNKLERYARNFRKADSHSKFAIRLFLVRRTILWQRCLHNDQPSFAAKRK
jgi:hypothetical protein